MPGKSGNPGGMVPGRSVTARLRDLLNKGEINGKPIKDGKQVADLLAEVILKAALQGDHKFVTTLLDRTEGKVAEPKLEGEEASAVDLLRRKLNGDGPPAA